MRELTKLMVAGLAFAAAVIELQSIPEGVGVTIVKGVVHDRTLRGREAVIHVGAREMTVAPFVIGRESNVAKVLVLNDCTRMEENADDERAFEDADAFLTRGRC